MVRASHQGYSRMGVEHNRTVQLGEWSLLVIDEVRGAGEHLLDLQFVLGPAWRASSEMMSGKTVSCVITGPRKLTLECASESSLTLSLTADGNLARVWRRAACEFYPDPNHGVLAC